MRFIEKYIYFYFCIDNVIQNKIILKKLIKQKTNLMGNAGNFFRVKIKFKKNLN